MSVYLQRPPKPAMPPPPSINNNAPGLKASGDLSHGLACTTCT